MHSRPASRRLLAPSRLGRLGAALFLGALAVSGCDCIGDDLGDVFPNMRVSPVAITNTAPVADDTEFDVTISNNSGTPLVICEFSLSEDTDPAISIVEFDADTTDMIPESCGDREQAWEIGSQDDAVITLHVRPQVVSTIEGELTIVAEQDARPESTVVVPIEIDAQDLGLPDIVVDPLEVDFERIGQFDVARASVTISNAGVRDLIIDSTTWPEEDEEHPIKIAVPIAGHALAPQESVSVELVFTPEDTEIWTRTLQIASNDPDEPLVEVPVAGQGSACPTAVAELLEDPDDIQPLDTVRLVGSDSEPATPGTTIETWEWVLEQRPVGSTAVLATPTEPDTLLTTDIAGDYQVRLTVYDSDGIRSCQDAVIPFRAQPTEDLHIQLVWDHPAADLDLHLLKEGGEPFTHEGDTYFSNRQPEWFPDNPESNPSLDADDDEGYGPENINIETPIPGSKWTVLVHYWNKQTDGDAFTIATLRLYAFGQQVLDLNQSFEEDETLWTAVEIEWGEAEGELPTVTQLGQVEAYPRPF